MHILFGFMSLEKTKLVEVTNKPATDGKILKYFVVLIIKGVRYACMKL